MKGMLEFNLPEEDIEFEQAVNARKYAAALETIRNNIRQIWKYEDTSEEVHKMVSRIYDEFFDVIRDYNLDI